MEYLAVEPSVIDKTWQHDSIRYSPYNKIKNVPLLAVKFADISIFQINKKMVTSSKNFAIMKNIVVHYEGPTPDYNSAKFHINIFNRERIINNKSKFLEYDVIKSMTSS